MLIATVFDPTKNMVLASMFFEELYGEDSLEGKEVYESLMSVLRVCLRSIFKDMGKH